MSRKFRQSVFLIATAVFLVPASSSFADGLPETETSVPASSLNWSGFYLGLHGGYASGDSDWTYRDNGYANTGVGQTTAFENDNGFAGGQVGLNHQFGNFLIGAEASISAFNSDDKRANPFFPGEDVRSGVDELFLATAKLGYTHDRWLAYVKGGYANGEVNVFYDDNLPPDYIANDEKRSGGWTIGGGVEYMILPNVILGVQYDFVDLDDTSFSTPILSSVTGLPAGVGNLNIDVENEIHMVSARLSFKLDRERDAAPLK